ncbi:MAG: hypothetical protein WDM78_15385 [Puia sp.]
MYRNRGGVSSQSYYRTGGIATRTANYNRPTLSSTRPGGTVNPGPNGTRPGTSNSYSNRPTTNGSAAGRPATTGYNPSNRTTQHDLPYIQIVREMFISGPSQIATGNKDKTGPGHR